MNEGFFKKAGLPEKIEEERAPLVPVSNVDALFELAPEIGVPTRQTRFLDLPNKLQSAIVADIKKQKQSGMSAQDILIRIDNLIEKMWEFEAGDAEFSDKNYKPKVSPQEIEGAEAGAFAYVSVKNGIKRIEEGEKVSAKKEKNYKN